jgi:hypothetical protein
MAPGLHCNAGTETADALTEHGTLLGIGHRDMCTQLLESICRRNSGAGQSDDHHLLSLDFHLLQSLSETKTGHIAITEASMFPVPSTPI